jgi:NTP pyrophosphatase (non-canonical NTP hydrolase)
MAVEQLRDYDVPETLIASLRAIMQRTFTSEKLALIDTEVAEAFEDHRNHRYTTHYTDGYQRDIPSPVGLGTELADVIIRVLDLAYIMGYDMETLVAEKMRYNKTRPFKHGGKSA